MPTLATATTPAKQASPDFPIHKLIAERWSPYGFTDQPVSETDLSSLFEAARWAASSYNEQPWTYFVATKKTRGEFARLLSCLVPANQAWAKAAPVLAIGCANLNFARDLHIVVHIKLVKVRHVFFYPDDPWHIVDIPSQNIWA